MNKQITTLWEQSAQRDNLWAQARYEKFAELIVFECIKIAVFTGDTTTGKAIKEHFGVET
jgi:hypothetical protein